MIAPLGVSRTYQPHHLPPQCLPAPRGLLDRRAEVSRHLPSSFCRIHSHVSLSLCLARSRSLSHRNPIMQPPPPPPPTPSNPAVPAATRRMLIQCRTIQELLSDGQTEITKEKLNQLEEQVASGQFPSEDDFTAWSGTIATFWKRLGALQTKKKLNPNGATPDPWAILIRPGRLEVTDASQTQTLTFDSEKSGEPDMMTPNMTPNGGTLTIDSETDRPSQGAIFNASAMGRKEANSNDRNQGNPTPLNSKKDFPILSKGNSNHIPANQVVSPVLTPMTPMTPRSTAPASPIQTSGKKNEIFYQKEAVDLPWRVKADSNGANQGNPTPLNPKKDFPNLSKGNSNHIPPKQMVSPVLTPMTPRTAAPDSPIRCSGTNEMITRRWTSIESLDLPVTVKSAGENSKPTLPGEPKVALAPTVAPPVDQPNPLSATVRVPRSSKQLGKGGVRLVAMPGAKPTPTQEALPQEKAPSVEPPKPKETKESSPPASVSLLDFNWLMDAPLEDEALHSPPVAPKSASPPVPSVPIYPAPPMINFFDDPLNPSPPRSSPLEDDGYRLERLRDRLGEEFAAVSSATSLGDLRGMQAILGVVSKALVTLSTLPADNPKTATMKREFFGLGLAKLATVTQSQYLDQEYNESLEQLEDFLIRRTTAMEISRQKAASTSGFNGSSGNLHICSYCKQPGHHKSACEKLKGLTCFNCYETGHSGKYCPNAPLIQMK